MLRQRATRDVKGNRWASRAPLASDAPDFNKSARATPKKVSFKQRRLEANMGRPL